MAEQQQKELVYVQTDCIAVTIKGTAAHASFSGVEFREKEASLRIVCDDPYDGEIAGEAERIAFRNLGRGIIADYRLRPIFFEQQRYEIIVEPLGNHTVEFWHENYNIRKNVTPIGRSRMLSGVINFGNEIGMSDLVFLVDGRSYLKLTIEVFPSKISYKDDYKAIVSDVTKEVYNLVFDFLKKTYDSFDISPNRQSSPVEFFAIIRKIYNEFITAADMVIAKPHHVLETEHIVLAGNKVKRTDGKTIRWIERHPELVLRTENGLKAAKALAVRKHVTYDTKENRLTKYMLQSTAKRLEQFRLQYSKLVRNTDDAVIREIEEMTRGIRRRANTGFLKEVAAIPANSGMSLVFGMAPGYRDLYRCYLLLQHGLSVTGSVFNVSLKDLAVLYEYWCFIKLNSLMKERYKLISQDIIKISGNGLFVSLVKGQRSRVHYLNPENGEKITLSYNPKDINAPTVSQKPDNVLKLEKRGAKTAYEYVFDAKYRINAALDGSAYQQTYGTPGPQEDDINTMHRYRDAIVYRSDASPFERTMFGAYVLFPYHNAEEYRRHQFFRSIEQVNIGGLPFLPSETGMVAEMLDELVADSPASAFERATLPHGIEERLAKVDWEKREVLIGFVRSEEQMQLCMEGKYYYTYKKNVAVGNLPIYYVALYSQGVGIEYYGKVLTTQEVKRSAIPGKGSKAEETCYLFTVSKWNKLAQPVRPQNYGPSPIAYTNHFLLTHSETYPELHLKNESEYRFFSELKRRSLNALIDENEAASGFDMDGWRVLFSDGEIRILQGDRIVDRCSIGEFSKQPNAVFKRFMRSVE